MIPNWLPLPNLLILQLSLSLLVIISSFFILNKNWKPSCLSKKPYLPPSPPRLPLIGNLHQLGYLPHRSLRALSHKYGALMLLRLGRVPTIVVSSADVAREVMKTHDLAFASRPKSTMSDKLVYGSNDLACAPYGEYWRQVRRVCVLHLLSPKMVQSFRSVREEEVAVLVEKIRASPGPINLSEMLIVLTNDIICRAAFGRKYSGFDSDGGANYRTRELLAEFMTLLGEVPIGDFVPGFSWVDSLRGLNTRAKRNFSDLDALIDKILEDHLVRAGKASDQGTSLDFVDVLLSLDTNTDGFFLTRNNIKGLILDMFAGGTDTTFAALEWIMAEIVAHPEVMKTLQQEVRGVVGAKEVIGEEDIDQMKYLKAVIKESLRLHPPVPLLVPHESTTDVQLCGYDIPARTRVIVNAWAIGRDPGSWERAEEFLPERFIDSSMDYKGHDFELIPFGAGRRGCPGIGFVVPNIELTIVNLVLHFDWSLPGGTKAEDLDMAEKFGMTVHKKCNLILVAKPLL